MLLNAPVLRLAEVNQDFRVEIDASSFAVAGVLLQTGGRSVMVRCVVCELEDVVGQAAV